MVRSDGQVGSVSESGRGVLVARRKRCEEQRQSSEPHHDESGNVGILDVEHLRHGLGMWRSNLFACLCCVCVSCVCGVWLLLLLLLRASPRILIRFDPLFLRTRSTVPYGINQRTMSGHWNKRDEEEDEVEIEEDDNVYKVRAFFPGGS